MERNENIDQQSYYHTTTDDPVAAGEWVRSILSLSDRKACHITWAVYGALSAAVKLPLAAAIQ